MSSLAQRNLPKSLRDEIQRYLDAHNKFRSDGSRVASAQTQDDRSGEIFRAYARLWLLGYRIKKPESIAAKHIEALMNFWDESGVSARTIHTRLSNLRTFCNWMGKRGVVKDMKDYLTPERVMRTTIAQADLSWKAKGIDPESIIDTATEFDERFGAMLMLQHYFYLRVKESIEIRPAESLIDNGDAIELHLGTKGGRPRRIDIKTTKQRIAFDFARTVAAKGNTGRLRWTNCTWKQAQRRFYWYMEKHGITKGVLGVTAHGLRHGGIQDGYERETGYPTPIKGGALGEIDRETHRVASMTVSRESGHARYDVVPTYCGSYGHALRVPPNQYKYTFGVTP
jgi:site-specific recombinase XerC